MLMIDPAYPPLWRDETTLQFGLPAVVTVRDPSPWQQRLIRALEGGVAQEALEPMANVIGAPAHSARDFVTTISAALAPSTPPAPAQVAVLSSVSLTHDELSIMASHLSTARTHLSSLGTDGLRQTPEVDIVVVVAAHIMDPRLTAELMAGDVVHLPIVLSGSGAHVGPVIVPGKSACMMCIGLHNTDADPAWPVLAAQLTARSLRNAEPSVLAEAATTAARMLSAHFAEAAPPSSVAIRVDSVQRRAYSHHPHAMCQCQSLSENVTAGDLWNRAPMSERDYARPA